MTSFQRYYPNKFELVGVPGVTTWVVSATDGTFYSTLAALEAAGKNPWPFYMPGFGGIQNNNGLGPLLVQSDSGGSTGSNFYVDFSQRSTPTIGVLVGGIATFDDVGAIYNLWVKMGSTTDTLRAAIRF